jgi:hypothetical protein
MWQSQNTWQRQQQIGITLVMKVKAGKNRELMLLLHSLDEFLSYHLPYKNLMNNLLKSKFD